MVFIGIYWKLGFNILNLTDTNMNIVFFGSSPFAVPALRALAQTRHRISCVVTQPDRKKGRGLHFEATAVKIAARGFGLMVYQPPKTNTDEAMAFFENFNPDLFIVISYGQILSRGILNIPKIFCLNVHASILPKYRGAAPINWAIINGEKNTGISIIKMTEKMDAGEIIMQKSTDTSDNDTIITLEDKLSTMAAELLIGMLDSVENNNYQLAPQDESRVSFAPKLKKGDGLIHWDKPAYQIYNLIRGVVIWPGAFTYYKGKQVKIYKARVSQLSAVPCLPAGKGCQLSAGQVVKVDKEGIVVAAGKDSLIIQELQIEGKRIMRAEEFIAGHKVEAGDRLGYPASSNQI